MDDIESIILNEDVLEGNTDEGDGSIPGDDASVAEDEAAGDGIDPLDDATDGTWLDDSLFAGGGDDSHDIYVWDDFGNADVIWDEFIWTMDDGSFAFDFSDSIMVDLGICLIDEAMPVDEELASGTKEGHSGLTGDETGDCGFVWNDIGQDETFDDGMVWDDADGGSIITIDFGVILDPVVITEGDPPAEVVDSLPDETDVLSGPEIAVDPLPGIAICIMYPIDAIA